MGIDPIFDSRNWSAVPFHFWSLVFFCFGCVVGSFLNVVIHRLPLGQSIVSPPSHCPHCKYSIPWYLNVPLLTWLSLRGRCKNCGAPISVRYFIVELITGLSFLGCWLAFGHESAVLVLVYCAVLAGLIAAMFIDFEHMIIPDEITIGGMIAGVIISTLFPKLHGQTSLLRGLLQGVLGAVWGLGLVYSVVRMGKLLFGRFRVRLDPDSRIHFGESGIKLPPQNLALLDDSTSPNGERWAVRAHRVELPDRCLFDVPVGVSKTKMVVGGDVFDRASAPHVELLVSNEMSVSKTAQLLGERASFGEICRGWVSTLAGLCRLSRRISVPPDAHLVVTNGGFWWCREDILFEETFSRKTDAIVLTAKQVRTRSRSWTDVPVRLSPDKLQIGEDSFEPEAVDSLTATTDLITIPREAMGPGDVKFMGAIGAFLGWQSVIFSLFASSIIGALVGISLIVGQKREWSSRLPYGPYIAMAAALWIFGGPPLHHWWLEQLDVFRQLLGGHPNF
jgi:leader peptidase (prepilin peptidase)/N-methyltransferase